MVDYYEFLQISPHADTETIHRVYRFLATRLHPDNPESGNAEMFFILKTAYDVLSNPTRRAEYDAARRKETPETVPLSTEVDFMDLMEGELNRRLAVLAVLYYKRRTNPYSPEVSLDEVERRMGFPRDYLDFTTWYLLRKGFITRADNSDFTLTAGGVDFVETQRTTMPILNKLLTTGEPYPDKKENPVPGQRVIEAASRDRRVGPKDRRIGLPDLRQVKTERRVGLPDRRLNKVDRRGRKPGE
ncbi:MAG TPA: J domain-containing protein [Terracidiphilus sp.]|jgi:curved DNA-binding protein CbpA|nr:J domain-containing protein [Terracidiphilus sp.]